MNTSDALQQAAIVLAPWTESTQAPESHRLDVQINATGLVPAVQALQQHGWGYLAAVTGLDLGAAAGKMEILYHFCEGAAVVTIRVRVPRDAAAVPTICSLIPSATLFERELHEMLGVQVDGTPDQSRLFLPDDWPEGVYPLRKDFAGEETTA